LLETGVVPSNLLLGQVKITLGITAGQQHTAFITSAKLLETGIVPSNLLLGEVKIALGITAGQLLEIDI
jgi:hypothetical protein